MKGPIYIMWLRQVKKYWRSKPRMIGALGQPLLFLLAFGFGFGPIFQKAGGGNYIEFLAPGIIAMSILFTAMFTGIEVIWDRRFGFLKETLVAPVSRTQIMIGRTLGGATVSFLQGIVVILMSLLIGFSITHWALLPGAILFMFLIAMLFTAFGTAIASRLDDMQAFPLIMNFLIMPIFFLSGALFPLEGLPKGLELVIKLNPLSYGVDGLRGTLTGAFHFSLMLDLAVMLGVTLAIGIIGTWLFSKIEV
ncbi:ABC transporter permease [Candidatus Woesearchaeota archaeon]|nr:MAG: antibiotic transport system permease protein [archaeon GW2011_AR4]MBS3129225.1 ABC transporter permease [Candidatus Woesearchaeota archaeon]HIH38528.1 ABC transporter permease [Candidatus Woesearchaeota archaeon]HIH48483.1 ABC transporter permease [Candidatus Woesearchaeota archaeon]HIJ02732.1 ABC transporter permease [Candidatus Woesearchaeota archaeon]